MNEAIAAIVTNVRIDHDISGAEADKLSAFLTALLVSGATNITITVEG